MVLWIHQNTLVQTNCESIRRTLSESRVRENRMHGLKRGAGINPCLYSTVTINFLGGMPEQESRYFT